MKAEVIDNTPHGYDVVIHYDNESCIIHEGMYHKGYAKKYADDFNSALSSHVSKETDPLLAEISDLKENINRLIEAHVSAEEDFSRLKSNIKTVSDENITGVVDETFKGLGSLINDEDLFYFYKQLIITMYAGMVIDKNMEIYNLQAEIDRLKNEVERLTNIGHTPESEMNELSTRELIERLIASQLKVEKLEFMIEHGLGYEDMANDITMPHEI